MRRFWSVDRWIGTTGQKHYALTVILFGWRVAIEVNSASKVNA